jgi:hypothetical protein
MSLVLGNKWSYDIVNSHLKINKILNVSKKSLIVAKNNIHNSIIEKLNNSLLNYVYLKQKFRIIAVDGTYINVFKSLHKDGFKLSKNKAYCSVLINTLFDVVNEIPINYGLFKHKNENAALIDQLKYIHKNDVLIMDRKYFSFELLKILFQSKIRTIFRLKSNLKIVKKLIKTNKRETIEYLDIDNELIEFRIVRYRINNKEYYLGTTFYDGDIDFLKYLYSKRWKIEIHFRQSKYNLSLQDINSTNENNLRRDILVHHFIFIVSSFIETILQASVKKNYKVSTSNMLHITINELLYLFLYKNFNKVIKSKIMNILKIARNTVSFIKLDRCYLRIRKRPSTKWCFLGNRFKFVY